MPSAIDEIKLAPEACHSTDIRREPFYLRCRDRSVFAWLHRPESLSSVSTDVAESCHGVVVCPPIGFEQLHAHRTLRHLCDQLALNNLPALRFDWDGTGDSEGDDTDSDRLSHWLDNVRVAVRWMKEQCGCPRVSVIGVRAGALLASDALQRDEIENLVLWLPVTSGRAFVRELHLIDKTSETGPQAAATDGTIEAAGFRLTPETAGEVSQLTLTKSIPNCHRILIAGRDDTPLDAKLVGHFTTLGIAVEQHAFPGMTEMLLEPHKGEVPHQAIRGITDWLVQQPCSNDMTDEAAGEIDGTFPQPADARLPGLGIRETPCWISETPNLFGILSEPETVAAADLPFVIVLNSGSACRIGPGRMNVEMTRRFASRGFRCLRLDLCGLGDSVAAATDPENDSYAPTMFRDIEITLEWVQQQFGARKIVLIGLCSGAYAAFQSAAQFRNPALVESILINPLTYYWCEGMTLETAPTLDLIREHYYLSSAFDPAKWLKLLSGRSSIGMGGALRLILRRLKAVWGKKPSRTECCSGDCDRRPSHPTSDDLTADLKRIAAADRQLSMIFSTTDPGYSILTCKAGRQAKAMLRRGAMSVQFIEDADHTFSRHTARSRLFEELSQHLSARYPTTGNQ